ncbi:MAG: type II toxin-antitoxin system antitoxin SocA domain-containing protein [Terriglobales bacterium]|jgi:uncharacterized phage-associated protein
MQATQDLTRGQLLMMLLAAPGARGTVGEPIQGTTRLQKLLFLMEREAKLTPTKGDDFAFEAWKFGPVSKELYDDLEKLENLGFLESEPVAEPSKTELDEYGLSFDDLMGEEESQSRDNFEEKRYRLSEKGLEWVRERELDTAAFDKIRKIKEKYGALSLQDLLHYVYTKFPDMTTASEIKGKVLRRR